jgi:hypothetical protein
VRKRVYLLQRRCHGVESTAQAIREICKSFQRKRLRKRGTLLSREAGTTVLHTTHAATADFWDASTCT